MPVVQPDAPLGDHPSLRCGGVDGLTLHALLARVRDGSCSVEQAGQVLVAGQHRESALHLSSLCRGVIHDLNNLRAGLFANLDYLSELMEVWARLVPPLERLVRAAALVPELRPYAEEIRSLDAEDDLAAVVEERSELLSDLVETRQRFHVFIERLGQVSGRNKGLLVEEDLEHAVGRVAAEIAQGRADMPRLTIHCATPLRFFTYRQLLERCLTELLQNAVEASGAEGRVEITLEQAREEVLVRIEDHGSGMDGEEFAQAFVPFYTTRDQASSSGVRRGLGLNVAQRAALLMGGDVALVSAAGVGTTAIVRLAAPSCLGRRVLVLGQLPDDVLRALPGALLVQVPDDEGALASVCSPRPQLLLLSASQSPHRALALLERLNGEAHGAAPLPVVRYHVPGVTPDGPWAAEEALEPLIWADAEDLEVLAHEVKRILCRLVMGD